MNKLIAIIAIVLTSYLPVFAAPTVGQTQQIGFAGVPIYGSRQFFPSLTANPVRSPSWVFIPGATSTAFTSMGQFGTLTVTLGGTGGVANGVAADGNWITATTGTTANQLVSWKSLNVIQAQMAPRFIATIQTGSDVTNINILVGITDTTTFKPRYGIDYDTSLDGTAFWRIDTGNASTLTRTATTAAIAANTTYVLAIDASNSAKTYFYINGQQFSSTTTLPSGTDTMQAYVQVQTRTTAAKVMKVKDFWMDTL